jgi:NADPH2:quinone reductase
VRAVRVETLEGPDALVYGEFPEPQPSPSQVLIEVHAAPVVFPDLLLTQGKYQMRPDLPFIPGGVVGGLVISAPPGSGFSPGDRVTSLTLTGGWAKLAVGDAALTFPVPAERTLAEGAAVPFNYTTMYFGLLRRGRLKPGETVLVHGAAGGIGTASVQLAAALGARVIAVVSSPDKYDVVREAGAHEVIPVEGFKDAARELTHGRGVDIVVDPVGGDRFTDSLRSLREFGRAIVVGFTGGSIPEVRVNRLLLNNTEVIGAGWGASVIGWPERTERIGRAIEGMIESGQVSPIIGARFPLERASDALELLDGRGATGKVVLNLE